MEKIGSILVKNNILKKSQLEEALKKQKVEGSKKQIGEILIDLGYIDLDTLFKYLDIQIRIHKQNS